WENFLETLTQLLSKALTDKETEALVAHFHALHERLRHIGDRHLKKLAEDAQRQQVALARSSTSPFSHPHEAEGKSCSLNASRGFLKAFAVGYGAKYILALLPLLWARARRGSSSSPSLGQSLVSAGDRDTLGFALFLGSFIGSYKGLLCLARYLRPHSLPDDPVNAFLAGSLAGLSLAFERNTDRRLAIAIYLSTRSLQYVCVYATRRWQQARDARRRGLIRDDSWDIPRMLQRWGGTAVMALSSSQILYAYICAPDSLPRSYYGFLVTHGGLQARYGSFAAPLLRTLGEAVLQLSGKSGADILIPPGELSADVVGREISPNLVRMYAPGMRHEYLGCALEHPWESSCVRAHTGTWVRAYGRSLRLYIPLNVL
ncbi:MAG: hypothetical protein DHS80DRAFT_1168, partial [Piptocephalis tieghemiana]